MGRLFLMSLEGKIYSCKHCRAHLGVAENIISKSVDMTATFTFSASDVDFDANFLSYGDITSRPMLTKHSFHCKHGKAYLFNKVVNVTIGTKEDRMMTTGMHTVSDVFCVGCGSIVGWKYEAAHEKAQKYKEGKVVLERYKLTGPDGSQYWIAHGAHMGGSDADDA